MLKTSLVLSSEDCKKVGHILTTYYGQNPVPDCSQARDLLTVLKEVKGEYQNRFHGLLEDRKNNRPVNEALINEYITSVTIINSAIAIIEQELVVHDAAIDKKLTELGQLFAE